MFQEFPRLPTSGLLSQRFRLIDIVFPKHVFFFFFSPGLFAGVSTFPVVCVKLVPPPAQIDALKRDSPIENLNYKLPLVPFAPEVLPFPPSDVNLPQPSHSFTPVIVVGYLRTP